MHQHGKENRGEYPEQFALQFYGILLVHQIDTSAISANSESQNEA
jgi:hypothetical protein